VVILNLELPKNQREPEEIRVQTNNVTELESQVKTAQTELDTVSKGYDADEIDEAQKNLDAVKSQLNDADNQLAKLKMSEASYNQANVTASYKDWTQAQLNTLRISMILTT